MNAVLMAMREDALADYMRGLAAVRGGADPAVALAGLYSAAAGQVDPVRTGSTVVIPVRGTIAPSGLGYAGTNSTVLADMIRSLAADVKVGAIVLDVQSPGGYVYGTQEAGDAIFAAREHKPVVAVANTFAFSAAYWLATQAGAFYATPSGEVGSVGVRTMHANEARFWEEMGVDFTLVASHPDKVAGNPLAPLSDADLAEMQAGVDEAHRAFVSAIARGRRMAAGEVPAVHGNGKTFSASRAQANGAIDGVMTLGEVIAKISAPRSRLALMRRQATAQREALG